MMLERRSETLLLAATAAALLGVACSSGDPSGSGGSGTTTTTATSSSSGTGGEGGAGGTMVNVIPSKGCGAALGAEGEQMLTLDVAGQTRAYLLSVPAGYTGKEPLALVLAFHERKSDGAGIKAALPIEAKAAGKAIFVYPDGQPQAIANDDTGWDLQNDQSNDVLLFDALVSKVSDAYCLDTQRVFAAGFGYGAEFADTLGCYRGDVLRAIAPVAGGNVFTKTLCKGTPAAWIAHGQDDAAIGYDMFAIPSRDYWLAADGCGKTSTPTEPSPCESYAGCAPGAAVTFCGHSGLGGHVIPPFAPQAIWDFFALLPH